MATVPTSKGPIFQTGGSQDVPVQGVQATTIPGSAAEFQSGIQQAVPHLQNLMNLNTERVKTDLRDKAEAELSPLAKAAEIQRLQLSQGTTLSQADPESLRSAAIQLVGGDIDPSNTQVQSIVDELNFLAKAKLAGRG